jgi:16S rRNA (adenine1518-N6/adenine1519-N6)-dimethyltransferase
VPFSLIENSHGFINSRYTRRKLLHATPYALEMHPARKPKLGQNFLVDEQARHRIANALGDVSQRTVIEIGPGHGAITEILAARAARLIAIELDRKLAAELRFRFRDQANVEIVEADVLKVDIGGFADQVDVVGNLPYYITSDILLHLFASADKLGRAVLMMQREVGERVAAAPGVRDYGLLSATTQMYAEVEHLFTLPPSAFQPPPDVYSSVLRLHLHSRFDELQVDAPGFDRFLKQAFAQKRKTLRNNLQFAGYDSALLAQRWPSELAPQARAEQVSLELMAELYRAFNPPFVIPKRS